MVKDIFKLIIWAFKTLLLFRSGQTIYSRKFEIGLGIVAWLDIIGIICAIIFVILN